MIIFYSVLIKKSNQTGFYFKKTETKPELVQTDWFGSVILGKNRFFDKNNFFKKHKKKNKEKKTKLNK